MSRLFYSERVKFEKAGRYRIQVQGRLDESWSDRLAGMSITTAGKEGEAPVATLIGHLRDQSQLSGVLNALFDLRLPILIVELLDDKALDRKKRPRPGPRQDLLAAKDLDENNGRP
jgi:hypothetical protein